MSDLWNAQTYGQFLDARTKPAKDLLFAIPDSFSPRSIYDLGCGPGNSTILLKNRWSDAQVIGLDSSADMLKEAQKQYPNLVFELGDLTHFTPQLPIDCIFANASLQWAAHHDTLIPRLLACLNPGGILAIQIPNNFHCPSHQVTLEVLSMDPTWQPLLKNIAASLRYGKLRAPFYKIADYYDLLSSAKATHIQLWETEYQQEMTNHQAIFDWVKGTGLRPVLTHLSASEQQKFEAAYISAITPYYPPQKNGKVLLPFRRLFVVATRE